MSLNAAAGKTRPDLWYALRWERRPSEQALMRWCYTWYQAGVITGDEATYLMNLAGYAAPGQQRQAHTATTEHRAICVPPKHISTEKLQPLNTRKNAVRS